MSKIVHSIFQLIWMIIRGLLILIMVSVLVGLAYQSIASYLDLRDYPPPGELVDVGDHRLHLSCTGAGAPTVVLEAGLGGFSLDWSKIQPVLAKQTRVCSYDRAGYGWSERGPQPRDAYQIAQELHALLAKAGVAGPYVFVGHSIGGIYAQMYAHTYPGEVAGMVLVDPTLPYSSEQLRKMVDTTSQSIAVSSSVVSQAPHAQPALRIVLRIASAIGVIRLFGESIFQSNTPLPYLTPDVQARYYAALVRSSYLNAFFYELEASESSKAEVRFAGQLPGSIPVVVLSSGLPGTFASTSGPSAESDSTSEVHQQLEEQFTQSLSPHSQCAVAEESGHYIQIDQPELVIQAVQQVLDVLHDARSLNQAGITRAPC